MTTFTDDDLKRLKESMAFGCTLQPFAYEDIKALLARMECAELYAEAMRKGRERWFNPLYENWQRSCGK